MPQLEEPTTKNTQLCTGGLWGEKGKKIKSLTNKTEQNKSKQTESGYKLADVIWERPGSPCSLFFFFKRFYFFPFSPQSPPVHSCIFFVVGPSSCGMWDAASAWSDEQCHVRAQDWNQ